MNGVRVFWLAVALIGAALLAGVATTSAHRLFHGLDQAIGREK